MTEQFSCQLADESRTLALGAALAAGAAAGRVLTLSGDLGAGKTTVVRGLLRALGHGGHVRSPTYTLVELYDVSSLNLYHFDFYRFKDRTDWETSGFREYFNSDSLCVVEWPERAAGLLSLADLEVRLDFSGAGRAASLIAHTAAGRTWLRAVRERWPPDSSRR